MMSTATATATTRQRAEAARRRANEAARVARELEEEAVRWEALADAEDDHDEDEDDEDVCYVDADDDDDDDDNEEEEEEVRPPAPPTTARLFMDDPSAHLHVVGEAGDPKTWLLPLPPPPAAAGDVKCPICLDELHLDRVKLKLCGHEFHRFCAQQALALKPSCPICKRIYAEIRGDSPPGQMTMREESRLHCDGFPTVGTIEMQFIVPSGIQGPRHPNPGARFTGTMRYALLPATPEGRELAQLLRVAFDRGLIFTVGTSLTTGVANTVVWAGGIHLKTSVRGGVAQWGFPDPSYFARLRAELRERGVE